MKQTLRRFSAGVALMGAAIAAQADGLLHVQQTIFGMDCAPCAYGVQQRLTKLPGVTKVDVSLNDGIASIVVAPDSPVTLAQMHEVLVDGGFTPKQAIITVEGRIIKDGEHLELLSGANRYSLSFPTGIPAAVQPDAHLKLEGVVSDPSSGPVPVLSVQSAEPVASR